MSRMCNFFPEGWENKRGEADNGDTLDEGLYYNGVLMANTVTELCTVKVNGNKITYFVIYPTYIYSKDPAVIKLIDDVMADAKRKAISAEYFRDKTAEEQRNADAARWRIEQDARTKVLAQQSEAAVAHLIPEVVTPKTDTIGRKLARFFQQFSLS